MIMIAPFLLMILHFSQMGFTEDLTFISVIHSFLEKSPFTIITERLANCKHIFPEKQGFSALFSVFLTERADFREKSRSGALPKRLLVWHSYQIVCQSDQVQNVFFFSSLPDSFSDGFLHSNDITIQILLLNLNRETVRVISFHFPAIFRSR